MSKQLDLFGKKKNPEHIAPVIARALRAMVDPDPSAPRPFVGQYLIARFGGKCCVCGSGIDSGASIVYDGQRAAHLGCGQPVAKAKTR